jgi:flagellar biosynthesis regulator FlbT
VPKNFLFAQSPALQRQPEVARRLFRIQQTPIQTRNKIKYCRMIINPEVNSVARRMLNHSLREMFDCVMHAIAIDSLVQARNRPAA